MQLESLPDVTTGGSGAEDADAYADERPTPSNIHTRSGIIKIASNGANLSSECPCCQHWWCCRNQAGSTKCCCVWSTNRLLLCCMAIIILVDVAFCTIQVTLYASNQDSHYEYRRDIARFASWYYGVNVLGHCAKKVENLMPLELASIPYCLILCYANLVSFAFKACGY